MLRPVALLLTALLLAGTAPAHAAASPKSPAAAYAAKAHDATNKARVDEGLKPLKKNRCLATYAARQAAVIAAAGELSHQDLGAVLSGCGLRGAGENVAVGFPGGKAVVKGWLASPEHRANIMTKSFHKEAIAAVRGPDGRWWVAQVFGR